MQDYPLFLGDPIPDYSKAEVRKEEMEKYSGLRFRRIKNTYSSDGYEYIPCHEAKEVVRVEDEEGVFESKD